MYQIILTKLIKRILANQNCSTLVPIHTMCPFYVLLNLLNSLGCLFSSVFSLNILVISVPLLVFVFMLFLFSVFSVFTSSQGF